jgi:hypothetical protein
LQADAPEVWSKLAHSNTYIVDIAFLHRFS